ncbi:MAG: TonB-dependent receptor [Nitrospirae bacterium]|nr:TonB-dependent receptor [Nitrospirota bacterium]
MHIVLALLIFALITSSPSMAFSDERVSDDTKTKVTAEEIAFEEIPIVVTASRRPQKIREAPSTIDVITSEDIKNWGVFTLDEALRLIPGMDIRRLGVFHTISMRGIGGGLADRSDRVLLLVDGRRINSAWDGSFRGDIPLTNVERVEVIRGPGSSLYGPNAFAGVINIITKSGDDVDGINPSIGTGGDETYLGEVLAGKRWNLLDGIITSRYYETDGQKLLNENEEFRESDIFGKIKYKGITLSAGHDKMDRGVPGRIGRSSLTDDWEYEDNFVDLSYGHQWEKVGVNLKGYLNETESLYNLSGQSTDVDSKVSGVDAQGTWKINKRNLLTAGIDLYEDKGSQTGQGTQSATNTGFYIEHEMKPLEPMILTLGGRYDIHSVYEDVFTPRLSAVYLLGEMTTLRASYGEAFRAPSFQDLYVDMWLTSTIHNVGNKDLKPEKVKTYELGINHSFTEVITGSLNLFYTKAEDLVVTQTTRAGGIKTNAPANIGEAEIKGFELGLKSKPFKFLSLFGNYSYQDGEDADGNNLLYAPKNKFNLGINIHPVEYAYLNLTARYVGNRDGYDYNTRQNVTLESYTVTDLKLEGNWKKVTAALAVYNLFNEIYEETKDYLTPERSYLVTVGYKF